MGVVLQKDRAPQKKAGERVHRVVYLLYLGEADGELAWRQPVALSLLVQPQDQLLGQL